MARRKRPWLAVLLSLLWPGLGHFYLEEDGVGVWLALIGYLGFLVSVPVLLLAAIWPTVPWLGVAWALVLAFAAVDAYRLALRYNRFGGPAPGPAKHIDFVDSANAPVTRTTLRLR